MHSAAGGSGGLDLVGFVSAAPTVGWIQGNGMAVVHNRSAGVHLNLSLVAGCRVGWSEGVQGCLSIVNIRTYSIQSYNMAQQCPTVHTPKAVQKSVWHRRTYVSTNKIQPKLTCIVHCLCFTLCSIHAHMQLTSSTEKTPIQK